MKIKAWENYVIKKYNAKKINDFLQLKKYLTNPLNYAYNFTPEEITETEISNSEYYSAYVFDEDKIAQRKVISNDNSGWNTTIVFLASKDKVTISDYFIHESNGLTREEMDKFSKDIYPLRDEKTFIWVKNYYSKSYFFLS